MTTARLRAAGVVAAAALVAGIVALALLWRPGAAERADPDDREQVALGEGVYAQYCSACHGARLEGQPDWQSRLPNGRLPAPPHDASGHTWHHPDPMLFGITRDGIAPYAPEGYESDMPAFAGTFSDQQIWAVLAFIKSRWPTEIRGRQAALTQRAAQ